MKPNEYPSADVGAIPEDIDPRVWLKAMNENRRPSKPYCYTWHGESLIHDVEFTDRPLSYNARVVYFNLTGLDADQYRAALEAWWQAKFRAVDNWVLRSEYAELLAKWEAMSSVA